ncbi:BglG family transcription antiterminator [Holdemania massiliensis]|uniref:BglG family transcription antiterminator n=1 Tax=Holdemania massiliensis TaxID=1468449 RepID=UPI0003107DE2|nr:HTH domain-containing protein [Holdemania massiliensis]
MATFSNRQLSILTQLVNHPQYVSSEELSLVTGFSPKTIRKDIQEMTEILEESYGIRVQSKKGIGYSLPALSYDQMEKLIPIFDNAYSAMIPYSSNELRIHYIIQRLIASDEVIRINDLAEELYISRFTVTEDLKMVRHLLHNYNLRLQRQSNAGLIVAGLERHKRSCILNEYGIFQLMRNTIYDCSSYKELVYLDPASYHYIRQKIQEIFKENNKYTISMKGVEKVVLAVIVMINRKKKGYDVDYSQDHEERYAMQSTFSYLVSKRILTVIGAHLKILFSENDFIFCAVIQLGFRNFLSYDEVYVKSFFDEGFRMAQLIVDTLVERTQIVEFSRDRLLKERLAMHLIPALIRIKHNLINDYIPGYITHKKYTLSTEFAVMACEVIRKKLQINYISPNEINYMAFVFYSALCRIKPDNNKDCRFAIVSVIGRDVATVLAEGVLKRFDQFARLIVPFAQYQIDLIHDDDFDYVITDLPREAFNHLNIPILEANFALGFDNDRLIAQHYHNLFFKVVTLKTFFNPELFFIDPSSVNAEQALHFMAAQIQQVLGVKKDLGKDLLRRERACTIERSNNLAFMITQDFYMPKSFFAVSIFEHPMMWFRESVQILMIFSPGQQSRRDILQLNREFEHFINDPEAIVKILQEPTYDNFVQTMETVILSLV